MKAALTLLLAACVSLRAFGSVLGGVVEFSSLGAWKEVEPGRASRFPTATFAPAGDRNAGLLVTLVPQPLAGVSDPASLQAFHRLLCRQMMTSPDQVLKLTTLKFADGTGIYATFEDPALAGKPPKRGDYKVATIVAAWFPPDVVLHATLFSDSASGADVTEGLQLLQSAKILAHPPATAAPASGPNIVIRGPDANLTLPAGRFKATGAAKEGSGYFSYADAAGVNLSGWLDDAGRYGGFGPFWAQERKALEKKAGLKIVGEQLKTVGAWSTVEYTIKLGELVQKNLRACRVEGRTWADLHLSSVVIKGHAADLDAILRQVELKTR